MGSEAEGSNEYGFTPEEKASFDAMNPAAQPDAPAAPSTDAPAADTSSGSTSQADTTGGVPAQDDDDEIEGAAPKMGADGKPERDTRRVSFHKFKKTEEQLELTRAELAKRSEEAARVDERLKMINEALSVSPQQQARNEEDDPKPDPEQDILGYMRWQDRQLAKLGSKLGEYETERTETRAQAQLKNDYQDDARSFAQQEPSFGQAYNFLMMNRTAEIASYRFGKDLSKAATDNNHKLTRAEFKEITDTVVAEERELVANAMQSNRSPAALLYSIARGRGFQPQAPAAQRGGQQAAQGGQQRIPGNLADTAASVAGGAPAPAGSGVNVAAEIAAIKNGQQAARSLSNGGGVPAGQLTRESLASMPMEQFEAVLASLSPDKQRELLGA